MNIQKGDIVIITNFGFWDCGDLYLDCAIGIVDKIHPRSQPCDNFRIIVEYADAEYDGIYYRSETTLDRFDPEDLIVVGNVRDEE